MNFQYWDVVIAAAGSFLVAYVGKKLDFKGLVRKAEIESKDEIYIGWEKMYTMKSNDYDRLKDEYEAVRSTVFGLEEEFSKLRIEMAGLKKSMEEKEQGYLLHIEKLEDKISELEEENAALTEEIAHLKEVN